MLKKKELAQKRLLKKKWLWYNGKMTKEEMDNLNWSYTPLNGLKVLKGDMDYYYDSDPDIQKSIESITYYKIMVDTIKEIIDHIKWRSQNIKNVIEFRKFTEGG